MPVTNPVRDLTLAHHIDACTTLLLDVTHGLHFPSTIALITQLSPITHCTDYTAESHQTLFISFGLPLSHRWVLFATANISERFPCVFSCWLPGPFTLIWLFAACLFDPAFLLDIFSVCHLHLCIVPVYVSALPTLLLFLLTERCLSDPLLFNKAAPGSQRHWPIITEPFCWHSPGNTSNW